MNENCLHLLRIECPYDLKVKNKVMETKTKNKLLIDKNHLNAILYSTNVD